MTGAHSPDLRAAMGINHLWAMLILEELARSGVTTVFISPGSRSAPLTIAAAANPKTRTVVHTDERAAAFCALGYGKATGRPAALICTSGTAVANYFPAVIEASQSAVPMVILSSDRPAELRQASSPQTVDQARLFGEYVRWHLDMPCPDAAIPAAAVLTAVDQAVYRAAQAPPGPVQLNCQFREPLLGQAGKDALSEYLAAVDSWQASGSPFTRYIDPGWQPEGLELGRIEGLIRQSHRGLIVAGPLAANEDRPAIIRLADRFGWPMLADINSGLRFVRAQGDPAKCILHHHDLYLRMEGFQSAFSPDLVLHFGGVPVSKSLNRYLERSRARYVLFNNHPFRQDPTFCVTHRVEAPPGRLAAWLSEHVKAGSSALQGPFSRADQAARQALSEAWAELDGVAEWAVARSLFEEAIEGNGVFLGNSLPVREADSFAGSLDKGLSIGCNRGVNGIDGTIASAVGFALGLNRPTTAMIGDLTFLHDINSLALLAKVDVPVTVVVLNNDGGGIFSFLPIAEQTEYFEPYFGTPHGLTFDHAAAQFGLAYFRPETMREFREVYREAAGSGRPSVIEVAVDRQRNPVDQRAICDRIFKGIQAQLLM